MHPAGLIIVNNTFVAAGSAGTFAPLWQNSRLLNNLFIGSGSAEWVISTGTPTPETSLMDYNGWRWFEPRNQSPGRSILWRLSQPMQNPRTKKMSTEWIFGSLKDFADATGYERHGVLLDYDIFEKCENPAGENMPLPALDFRPRAGSKAVDAGLSLPNLTDGHAGAAPDLGALELGAPRPQYGPRKLAAEK